MPEPVDATNQPPAWSWHTAGMCGLLGAVSVPAVVFLAIGIGEVGVLACVLLPVLVGYRIGRLTRRVSSITGYASVFGLVGSLPLMAYMLAGVDPEDRMAPLVRAFSVGYPLMAGVGLAVIAEIAALVSRRAA